MNSQDVEGPLTRCATFLTLSCDYDDETLDAVRDFFGTLPSLVKAVGFRNKEAGLSCVIGIGAHLWDHLNPGIKPKGLHPFKEIQGVHHAPATPGDILLHIRAATQDYCFELTHHIMNTLGDHVKVEDETQGFKFFDNRDLLGFVDGTENPVGTALNEAVLVSDEDAFFHGSSYVIVQKYLHDMKTWDRMPVEHQETIIGRHKLSDIEFADEKKASYAHNVLTNIEDSEGNALEILRDNMPFGSPGNAEYGTYFIGYGRDPDRIETMLNNMFIGLPPGNYDRILDVSTAITGGLFFVPTADLLDALSSGEPLVEKNETSQDFDDVQSSPDKVAGTGSLNIGSLKPAK